MSVLECFSRLEMCSYINGRLVLEPFSIHIVTWATILETCNVLMTRTLQDKLQSTRYSLQRYFAILREVEDKSTFLQLKQQFFFVKHSSEAQFCPKLSRNGVSLQVVRENTALCDSASNVPE